MLLMLYYLYLDDAKIAFFFEIPTNDFNLFTHSTPFCHFCIAIFDDKPKQ